MPRLQRLAAKGSSAVLDPVLPAVTCSVQSTFLTGLAPAEHGIVGNGWYFRDLGEVHLWRQHNRLVQGEKVWETPTGSVIYDSSFAFGGGNLYLSAVDGTLCAVRAADGTLQWRYRLGTGHVFATPATDDRRVYIGSLGGSVTAFPLPGVPTTVAQR